MNINNIKDYLKNLDPKDILIVILCFLLIINFFFGQSNKIDYGVDEIKLLHQQTDNLLKQNDSLKKENIKIDCYIKAINEKIDNNSKELEKTKLELNNLKNKRIENDNYVNHLSNDGVADEFTKYLNNKTKGNGNHR